MSDLSCLDKAIIATLAYADIKDWPLTLWEVFRYLISPKRFGKKETLEYLGLKDIIERLEFLREKGIVETRDGFWFLKKRERERNFLASRITRENLGDQKWKLLRKRGKFFKKLPFIRGILVSGSLACGWVRKKSDFDLLIISKRGRIWIVRFLANFFLAVIGKKRGKKKTKDRFCLNHFITDASLGIPFKSLYNAWTYIHLVPLLGDTRKVLGDFQKANSWVGDYLFFGFGSQWQNQRTYRFSWGERRLQRGFEVFIDLFGGNFWERILKRVQVQRIKKQPLAFKKGGRLTLSERQLEFHPESPEKRILKAYNQKIKKLGLFSYRPEKDSGLL